MFARRKPVSVVTADATPSLRDVDPELGRLEDKRDELNRQAAEVLAEFGKLASELRDARDAPARPVTRDAPRVSVAAGALLDGIVETRRALPPGHADPRHRRLGELQDQRAALLEAVATLEPIIRDRAVLASWVLCREQRPAYDVLVAAIKTNVEATLDALAAAEAFLVPYRRAGVALGRLDIVRTEDLKDELAHLLRSIAERKPIEEP